MLRSIRLFAIGIVSLAALALCTSAWAQTAPENRPRPGFGMFGGGGPGASLSMLYGPLLRAPTVQKELDLIDDQETEIKAVTDKAQAAMRELFSGMRDLSQEERRAKMEENSKKIQAQAEEMSQTIKKTLLPNQLKRLKGIALQVAGVQALNDKEIQQDLKLSSDQIAKIKSVGEDSMKKIRDLFSAGGDRQTIGPKMQELRKDSEKQILDVLTADQKAAFEKMKGDKLEIPAEEFRGFGGRRGPRPAGAGENN